MPRGSKYEGPSDALAAYLAIVENSQTDAEVKGAKNPYTARNGNMYSFLDADGTMAIRLSPELTREFRSSYASGDVIQYGSTMRGYSSVPTELLRDPESLTSWFERAWEWIGTQPAKPTKNT